MYSTINFPTKKALIAAFKEGCKLTVFQPGGMFPGATDGKVCIEGPHYPKPHSWYASATIADSVIVAVK